MIRSGHEPVNSGEGGPEKLLPRSVRSAVMSRISPQCTDDSASRVPSAAANPLNANPTESGSVPAPGSSWKLSVSPRAAFSSTGAAGVSSR